MKTFSKPALFYSYLSGQEPPPDRFIYSFVPSPRPSRKRWLASSIQRRTKRAHRRRTSTNRQTARSIVYASKPCYELTRPAANTSERIYRKALPGPIAFQERKNNLGAGAPGIHTNRRASPFVPDARLSVTPLRGEPRAKELLCLPRYPRKQTKRFATRGNSSGSSENKEMRTAKSCCSPLSVTAPVPVRDTTQVFLRARHRPRASGERGKVPAPRAVAETCAGETSEVDQVATFTRSLCVCVCILAPRRRPFLFGGFGTPDFRDPGAAP